MPTRAPIANASRETLRLGPWLALSLTCCTSSLATVETDAMPRDAQCLSSADDVTAPDVACPNVTVEVVHTWSAPQTCDRVLPRCSIAPECRFTTHLVAPPLAGCTEPSREGTFVNCRCEFGVIECPGEDPSGRLFPSCVGNSPWCYRCNP